MYIEGLYQFIEETDPQGRALWRHLAEIESPSGCKEGVDEIVAHLDTYAGALGLSTRKYEYETAGSSLVAETQPRTLPAIALMAHMDTVHKKGTFPGGLFRIDGDTVRGPGVYDCKGGIAVAFQVARALQHIGYHKRQIKILLIGDEEVAHSLSGGKSLELYEKEIPGCCCAFNCESGFINGDVTIERKGGGIAEFTVHGVEAHAGSAPSQGASAIAEAARKIGQIEVLSDWDSGKLYNCGLISGGTGANVIPGQCSFQVGLRFIKNADFDEEMRNLETICADNHDARVKTDICIKGLFKAMETTEKTQALLALYQDACRGLKLPVPQGVRANGCSDASFVTLQGVPALCGVGVRGEFNHSLQEYALLSSLSEQVKKICTTILSLPDDF